jgi:tetratricopeptide (TPR) repeat protein
LGDGATHGETGQLTPASPAQTPAPDPAAAAFREDIQSVPPGQRAALDRASAAHVAGNIDAAIDALRDIPEAEADPFVLMFLGEMYERKGDWNAAAAQFRSSLRRANAALLKRWNVYLKLGRSLYSLKRYSEAIPALERAWRHPTYVPDDVRAFGMLAEAYEFTGQLASALVAHTAVVVADLRADGAWEAIARVRPRVTVAEATERAASLEFPLLRDIPLDRLWTAGSSRQWTAETRTDAQRTYVIVGDVLTRHGFADAGLRFFIRAAEAGATQTNRPVDVTEAIARIGALIPLERLSSETQESMYVAAMEAHRAAARFSHAMAVVEQLLDSTTLTLSAPGQEKLAKFLASVAVRSAASVSFDLATGLPREQDPDDYVGHCTGERLGSPDPNGPFRDPTGRCTNKYGSTSYSEDLANLSAAIFSGVDNNVPLRDVVQRRLDARNLELPVKLIGVELMLALDNASTTRPWDREDLQHLSAADVLLDTTNRLVAVDSSGIRPSTLEALDSLTRLRLVVKRMHGR